MKQLFYFALLLFLFACNKKSCIELGCGAAEVCNEEFQICQCNCGVNATCVNRNTCACNANFIKDENGKCTISIHEAILGAWQVEDQYQGGISYYEVTISALDPSQSTVQISNFGNTACTNTNETWVVIGAYQRIDDTALKFFPINSLCPNLPIAVSSSTGAHEGTRTNVVRFSYIVQEGATVGFHSCKYSKKL